MSELLRFFKDMRDNGYGLAEIAAQLGTSAIAEPVAGFAAMYDPQHGADAIREGMTYAPRTQAAQEYSQSVGNAAKTAIKPAMPIIDTWKKGVDIAGQYSPVVGAALRTVPTAIGIAMGAKPALQAGRQASKGLEAMQGRMIANANAPRTLNTGYMGQRGAVGTQRPLTEFEQAHLTAQRNAALPVNQGGLGLPANNTAMDRARAMGFDEADYYHGTRQDFNNFDVNKTGTSTDEGFFGDAVYSTKRPADASEYAQYDLKEALPRLTDNGIVVPLKIRKNAYQTDKAALLAHDVAKIKKDGYDSIENSLELASFDPKNIRSRFAAFDPFNRESSNLLATTAPLVPTTALGAYMYNENRKKSQGKQ